MDRQCISGPQSQLHSQIRIEPPEALYALLYNLRKRFQKGQADAALRPFSEASFHERHRFAHTAGAGTARASRPIICPSFKRRSDPSARALGEAHMGGCRAEEERKHNACQSLVLALRGAAQRGE